MMVNIEKDNKKISKVRVRYAPSPTGFLHLGNARTALFNYLFARHYKGSFIVRTEDTDTERNIPGAIDSQFNYLEWMGIQIDESETKSGKFGPYKQLERLDIYSKYADMLVQKEYAYHCFCSFAELQHMRLKKQYNDNNLAFKYPRTCLKLSKKQVQQKIAAKEPFCLRIKSPANKTYRLIDMVRGLVVFESNDIGDWVIMKENGIPTYNFAVVIDDYLMKITHVIRGEEHISNTPNQMMIYEYLEWPIPEYAHLTLIVNRQRKKLSKRDQKSDFFISNYRLKGYLPQALFNFLALLGWSPDLEEEIFDKKQLIKIFDPSRWSKSSSMFDLKKLQWMNNYYIKKLEPNAYYDFVRPFLQSRMTEHSHSEEWFRTLVTAYQNDLIYGRQILELTDYFWRTEHIVEPELCLEFNNFNWQESHLDNFAETLESVTKWSPDSITQTIKEFGVINGYKGKNLYRPLRLAATLNGEGPQLAITLYLIGKEQIITNIRRFINVNYAK